MTDFLQRLKAHKLVQWAVAYVAAAWVVLQVLDLVFGSYHWPDSAMHITLGVLAVGFVVVLVLAWYHGERGSQRVSGTELLIIPLILALGGAFLWNYSRTTSKANAAPAMASTRGGRPTDHNAGAASAGKQIVGSARSTSAAAGAAPSLAAQPIPAKSVAVLPFENLSTDKANAYFADGMQDLILTKLADIGDLKVISRTSTLQYGSHPENMKRVGEQLGVAAILEGSVQKAGNQVLINVQLINASTDGHIWAQTYQRTLDNIFGVEGEVASKVANALNAQLTQAESARVAKVPTQNPAAWDAYLRGLMIEKNQDASKAKDPLRQMEGFYTKAVTLDPGFALAWAHLSYTKTLMYSGFRDRSLAFLAQAKQAADTALRLQPNLGEGYLVLAQYYYLAVRDLDAAIPPLNKARALLPNNADVLVALSDVEERQGKWQDANAHLRQAAVLEPRTVDWLTDLAYNDVAMRQFSQARANLNRALVLTPDDKFLVAFKVRTWQSQGDLDKAQALLDTLPASSATGARMRQALFKRDFATIVAAFKSGAAQHPDMPEPGGTFARTRYAVVLDMAGHKARACAMATQLVGRIERLRQSPADDVELSGRLARMYAILGNKAAALREARRNVVMHSTCSVCKPDAVALLAQIQARFGDTDAAMAVVPHLLVVPSGYTAAELRLNPAWDPLRKDPRFHALLKQYDQPAPAAASSNAHGGGTGTQ